MDKYLLRDDRDIALQQWRLKYNRKQLDESYTQFFKSLQEIIYLYTGVGTFIVDYKWQIEFLKNLSVHHPLLNLDWLTYTPGQFYYSVSRVFEMFDIQARPLYFTQNAREAIPLPSIALEPGHYIYVDDDIASGSTYRYVREKLSLQRVQIVGCINLAQAYCDYQGAQVNIYDILDPRDFLIGAHTGGLVCQWREGQVRVPYLSPWVNLETRARVAKNKCQDFTRAVIEANLQFFTANDIHWSDIDANTARVLQHYLYSMHEPHTHSSIRVWCHDYLRNLKSGTWSLKNTNSLPVFGTGAKS